MAKEEQQQLSQIENKLSMYINSEKNEWINVYRLMNEVKTNELFKLRDLNSFNAWVSDTAVRFKIGVSTLWRKFKAGKVYEEYANRLELVNRTAPNASEINISPDTLSSIETLAGKDATKMVQLIDKAIAGELSRSDIRMALKSKRRVDEGSIPKSRHNAISADERISDIDVKVKAYDIILELHNYYWLYGLTNKEINTNDFIKTYLYKLFDEMGVITGTSRHKRRLDGVVVENLLFDNKDNDGINIHGLEIKVDKYDLLGDKKMQEYTDFVDYFSIVIPNEEELINIAKNVKLNEWGIMVYDPKKEKKLFFIEKPKKLNPIFRDKLYESIILKLAGKKGYI